MIVKITDVNRECEGAVTLVQRALETQSELGQRIVEAKSKTSAEEIETALNEVCRDVMLYVSDWVALGKRAVFGTGCVLSWAEEYWPELTPIHAQYKSFDEMAKAETGEEYSTYRAKIAIYRVFIQNRYSVPKIAEIGARQFLDVATGKLQKAVAKAKKNDMSDDQWEALIDPNVNDAQFAAIMHLTPEEKEKKDKEFLDTGGNNVTVNAVGELVYWRSGDEIQSGTELGVPIGQFNVKADDEKVREAIDGIIEKAKIKRI